MPSPLNLTDIRFGRLVAKVRVGSMGGRAVWRCVCDCGGEIVVPSKRLRNGATGSCGCYQSPDITGQRFHRLVALERLPATGKRGFKWRCQCDCGGERVAFATDLRGGHVKSCGCLQLEHYDSVRTHGKSKTPTWDIWAGMWKRCTNKKSNRFPIYGGRGIKVCERWASFENFLADMGERPSALHSIDRHPNKDGDYEPTNCRWATNIEQCNNRRTNRRVEVNGIGMTVAEAARALNVNYYVVYRRVMRGEVSL